MNSARFSVLTFLLFFFGQLLTCDCDSTEFFHAAGSDFIYIPRVLILYVPQEIK